MVNGQSRSASLAVAEVSKMLMGSILWTDSNIFWLKTGDAVFLLDSKKNANV